MAKNSPVPIINIIAPQKCLAGMENITSIILTNWLNNSQKLFLLAISLTIPNFTGSQFIRIRNQHTNAPIRATDQILKLKSKRNTTKFTWLSAWPFLQSAPSAIKEHRIKTNTANICSILLVNQFTTRSIFSLLLPEIRLGN